MNTINQWLEGKKKTGKHEFAPGWNTCMHCNQARKGVYRTRDHIIVDEKSGGSSAEVTVTEWDITGQYCKKNTSSQYNQAITDLQAFLPSLLSAMEAEIHQEIKQNIGMLRQWLNEDRITDTNKMVTNEEIEKFLFLTK